MKRDTFSRVIIYKYLKMLCIFNKNFENAKLEIGSSDNKIAGDL